MAAATPPADQQRTAAIVTLSDAASHGQRADMSGDIAATMLQDAAFQVTDRHVLPDEQMLLERLLRQLCDDCRIRLVVTTGGTGLGPRDITPEATYAVVDRLLPGMAEAMRMASLTKTPFAMTSRQVCGARGQSLIVNLPGSPAAVRECLEVILPVLPHTLDILAGHTRHPSAWRAT